MGITDFKRTERSEGLALFKKMAESTKVSLTLGIAGLTSRLCRLIARILLERHPHVLIRGLVRNLSSVPADIASHSNVSLIHGDALDQRAIEELVQGCDVVLCGYLSPDDKVMVDGQKLLIDACVADGGVKKYFASDWTLDYTGLSLGELDRKDPMILVKRYLEERRERDTEIRLRGVHVLIAGFMETVFSTYFSV